MKFPVHKISTEPAMATITRSAREMWPFLAGFGLTGYVMLKVAMGSSEADIKASKMVNPGH